MSASAEGRVGGPSGWITERAASEWEWGVVVTGDGRLWLKEVVGNPGDGDGPWVDPRPSLFWSHSQQGDPARGGSCGLSHASFLLAPPFLPPRPFCAWGSEFCIQSEMPDNLCMELLG